MKDSLLQVLNQSTSDSDRIAINLRLADSYVDKDLSQALQHALTAVQLSQKKENKPLRIKALVKAGTICFYGGLFNRSVQYFTQALEYAKQAGDLQKLGSAHFNLGGVHNQLGNLERSRVLTEQGFQYYVTFYKNQHTQVPPDIKFTYFNNLGLIYMKEKKTDISKTYLLNAVKLSRGGKDKMNFSRSMTSLAELYISLGILDSARLLLEEVIVFSQRNQQSAARSVAYSLLGDLLQKKSDLEGALNYYRGALALAEGRKDETLKEQLAEKMSAIFQLKGRPDSTLFYLEMHHRLKESSEKAKARESLVKEYMESLLREQEQSANRQLQIERTVLGIIAGISIGLFLLFLIRNRKRNFMQKLEASLQEEKLRMEKESLLQALDLKDKQLAGQVIYSLQKNEMISDLVNRIKETNVQGPDGQKGSLGKFIRDIESLSTEPWKEFEQRFQEVHAGFYERLMSKYPDLTSNERRLCSFLRLDMSTKEISNLTGQSVKAITQARFRLRGKLGIENPNTSVFEVLLHI